jgi:hypothetical protein
MTPEGMIISTLISIIKVSKLLLANTLRVVIFFQFDRPKTRNGGDFCAYMILMGTKTSYISGVSVLFVIRQFFVVYFSS